MSATGETSVGRFLAGLEKRNPNEPEFLQAVRHFAEHVMPLVDEREELRSAQILERMTEPDRIVIFGVTWQDDQGNLRANRAWRVQFNNSLGPYKGGLRFHPDADISVLKFLELEEQDARRLAENGCRAVVEGANMPATTEAARLLRSQGVLFAPAKGPPTPAGWRSRGSSRPRTRRASPGAATRSTSACARSWMTSTTSAWRTGGEGDVVDYALGADRASFERVAEAMLAHGAV